MAGNIDNFLLQCYKNKQFNGNVLVAQKGEIIYHKSYGVSNINPVDSLSLNSQFRLASVSKQFTAMGIMILEEQGKLNYDDKMVKYLPELPYRDITIRHLLNHTSGIPKYEKLCADHWDLEHEFKDKKYVTNDDVISMLVEHHPEPMFKILDRYSYSNTGYVLLASIVAKVSKMPFERFMKENIFDPLEMNSTLVYSAVRDDEMKNRVYGFRFALNGTDYTSNDFHFMSGLAGDGAMYSTTEDLLKWDRALYTEKLVSKATLEQAFSAITLNNGKISEYGFGWGIKKTPNGKKAVSHGGGWIAARTWIYREIEDDNTIIILTNHTSNHIRDIQYYLTQILHEKPYENLKVNISQVVGKILATKDIKTAIDEYKNLKSSKPDEYKIDKWELNTLGYELMNLKMYDDAIAIFNLNLEEYPDFFRGYNSLGELYTQKGDRAMAIKSYEKTLEIDSDNWWAKDKLKQLKKETIVVNLNDKDYDEYIGRDSKNHVNMNTPGIKPGTKGWLGNPHPIGDCKICNKTHIRDECIEAFNNDFYKRIENDQEFREAVLELKGKRLGCFCKPKACHGDVIKQWLDSQK